MTCIVFSDVRLENPYTDTVYHIAPGKMSIEDLREKLKIKKSIAFQIEVSNPDKWTIV